jgi:hypothetical protein
METAQLNGYLAREGEGLGVEEQAVLGGEAEAGRQSEGDAVRVPLALGRELEGAAALDGTRHACNPIACRIIQ